MSGPPPKRSDQRIRRNKPDFPIETVTAIGVVPIPDLNLERAESLPVHPLVDDLYQSLRDSAQSKWYEPSDWHYARMAFHFLNVLLWTPNPSGEKISAVNSMLTNLLMTEGERRRVRLEIERKPAGPETGTEQTVADMFRDRLGAG